MVVGDAAHSVLPPTGEGINSGLEDCHILGQIIDSANNHDAFEQFNKIRTPHLHALMEYAEYLNDAFDLKTPGEGASRLIFMIMEVALRSLRVIVNVPDHLFGVASAQVMPYQYIFKDWQRCNKTLLNLIRLLVYPPAFVLAALKRIALFVLGRWKALLVPSVLAFFYRAKAAAACEWIAMRLVDLSRVVVKKS